MNLKQRARQIPVIGDMLAHVYVKLARKRFSDSADYWETRYQKGGNSGNGSYGELAEFKAEFLNGFVADNAIRSVIEFGSGDGNQLLIAAYPAYLGIDISTTAIEHCREMFADDDRKRFMLLDDYDGDQAELSMSLDVIYHLVEDEVFESHMRDLFAAGSRFVIVYASNTDEQFPIQSPHVRHRKFTDWVDANAPEWTLAETIVNPMPFDAKTNTGSFADFHVFAKKA